MTTLTMLTSTVTTLVRVVFPRYLGRFSKERSSATKEKRTVLIPTIGDPMQYLTEIKGLDNMSDAYIIPDRIVNGQRCILLVAVSPLARQIVCDKWAGTLGKVAFVYLPTQTESDYINALEDAGAVVSI